jgi:hypothetical protein
MSCRGVLFALTGDQAVAIQNAQNDESLMEVIESIEEEWNSEYLAECDKSWDALHRLLGDGTLNWEGGSYPLNQVILGKPSIHDDSSYIVCFKECGVVRDIARALRDLDRAKVKELYFSKVPPDYALEYGGEDCEYTCDNFEDIREFYLRAAEANRAVIFTVDQ